MIVETSRNKTLTCVVCVLCFCLVVSCSAPIKDSNDVHTVEIQLMDKGYFINGAWVLESEFFTSPARFIPDDAKRLLVMGELLVRDLMKFGPVVKELGVDLFYIDKNGEQKELLFFNE